MQPTRLKWRARLRDFFLLTFVVLLYLGTAGQVLTHLGGHPLSFALWWLVKLAGASLTVVTPILLGYQTISRHRFKKTVGLVVISALGFLWAKYTTQPVVNATSPSPELYVGKNLFVAWLLAIALYLFGPQLKRWLHQWPIASRRRLLLGLTAAFFLIRLVNGFDLLGFHGGTSAFWYGYLFALGDWLAGDRAWLKRWSRRQWAGLTALAFLLAGALTWLDMDKLAYSPHHGLTLSTHYLLGINTYQPLVVIFALLAVATWLRGHPRPLSEPSALRLILLVGLLGTARAVTPLLLPTVNWPLATLLALVLIAAGLGLPTLISGLAAHWHWQPNWANWRPRLVGLLRRWWPLALAYALLWLVTVIGFALLWQGDRTMIEWVLTRREAITTVNVMIALSLTLILVAVTNRWWLSIGLTLVTYLGWLVATQLKVAARAEPILPTDLSTVTAPKELLGMVNPALLIGALLGLATLIAAFAWLEHRLGDRKQRLGKISRAIIGLLAVLFLAAFTRVNHSQSVVYKQLQAIGDTPYFYSQLRGAKLNGSLLQFANNVDVQVMTKPAGYSKEKMASIERRYTKLAEQINRQRDHDSVGKQNLAFVLSESFADPTRLPTLNFSSDPLPFYHRFKQTTTSGLMLSSGYGGGTANMEYMALTGLSMANFSATMPTPYSQLVPYQKRTFTINNLFDYAIGIHPFTANLYSRKTVYKKFGFNKFYHLDGGSKLTYTKKVQNSPRISDQSTYQEILLNLKRQPHGKFVQVATMQNHMPYETSYYKQLNYKVTGKNLTASEKSEIETYAQGIHYTDAALKRWIKQLDELKQPTTVVWYGDHLPGIYSSLSMGKYGVKLHETDYFIYSNKAARKLNHDRLTKQHQLVSPNDFAAMALAKMDVKVSPYYALLTAVLEKLPATALPVNGTAKNNAAHQGGVSYVNQAGKLVKLTKRQQKLFDDYRLVQYDLTAGHHYLLHDRFLKKVVK